MFQRPWGARCLRGNRSACGTSDPPRKPRRASFRLPRQTEKGSDPHRKLRGMGFPPCRRVQESPLAEKPICLQGKANAERSLDLDFPANSLASLTTITGPGFCNRTPHCNPIEHPLALIIVTNPLSVNGRSAGFSFSQMFAFSRRPFSWLRQISSSSSSSSSWPPGSPKNRRRR